MGSLPHPHQEDPEGRPLPSVTPFFFATLPSFIDAWNSSPGSHVVRLTCSERPRKAPRVLPDRHSPLTASHPQLAAECHLDSAGDAVGDE
jgi:hypothetical protein